MEITTATLLAAIALCCASSLATGLYFRSLAARERAAILAKVAERRRAELADVRLELLRDLDRGVTSVVKTAEFQEKLDRTVGGSLDEQARMIASYIENVVVPRAIAQRLGGSPQPTLHC